MCVCLDQSPSLSLSIKVVLLMRRSGVDIPINAHCLRPYSACAVDRSGAALGEEQDERSKEVV